MTPGIPNGIGGLPDDIVEIARDFRYSNEFLGNVVRAYLAKSEPPFEHIDDLPPHDHTIEPGEINRRGCHRCHIEAGLVNG